MCQKNEDYSDFYKTATKNIQCDHLNEKYNIPDDVQRKCDVGYAKRWKHPLTLEEYPCIIIPHSETSYLAIDATGQHGHEYIGNTAPFNIKSGLEADFPFVVRDAISAMSVMAAGGGAFSPCTDDVSSIVDILKKNARKNQCFIFALNDTVEGEELQRNLIEEIKAEELDIKFIEADDSSTPLNDMLKADKDGFQRIVTKLKERASNTVSRKTSLKPFDTHKAITECCDFTYNPEFIVHTGFRSFDDSLHGGFTAGIHLLGAIPASGKTTYFVQMGDQIAQQGIPVLFFSLEIKPKKLVATSIARHTYLDNGNKTTETPYGTFNLAKDSFSIWSKQHAKFYTEIEKNVIRKAADEYKKYSDNIKYYDRSVLTENGKNALENIASIIKNFAKIHNRFIVFIDYIQLLTRAIESRYTDKKAIDIVANELKDISYNYDIPIVCISSTNRSSYDSGASLSDFKESGNLEFIAESLMSFQIPGMDISTEDKSEQKRKIRVQELKDNFNEAKKSLFGGVPLQLKILKTRNDNPQDVYFNVKYAFGYFEEITEKEAFANTSTMTAVPSLTSQKRRAV